MSEIGVAWISKTFHYPTTWPKMMLLVYIYKHDVTGIHLHIFISNSVTVNIKKLKDFYSKLA